MTNYWKDFTTKEIEQNKKFADDTLIVIPTGAIEQHGPHLPLSVDTDIIEALLDKLPTSPLIKILPALSIGCSPEHKNFSGTLSFSSSLFSNIVREIVSNLANKGYKKFLFFNGHGGNSDILKALLYELKADHHIETYAVNWYRLIKTENYFDEKTINYDIHGGAVETSVMMYIKPDLVKKDLCQNFIKENSKKTNVDSVSYGWKAEELNIQGAIGNASIATRDIGQKIFNEALDNLTLLLSDLTSGKKYE